MNRERVRIVIETRSPRQYLERWIDYYALEKLDYLYDLYTTEAGERPTITVIEEVEYVYQINKAG